MLFRHWPVPLSIRNPNSLHVRLKCVKVLVKDSCVFRYFSALMD